MPNLTKKDCNALAIDERFKTYERNDLKVVYSLKLDGESKPEKQRIIAKILKLDENNQYRFAMTKPMPTPIPAALKITPPPLG